MVKVIFIVFVYSYSLVHVLKFKVFNIFPTKHTRIFLKGHSNADKLLSCHDKISCIFEYALPELHPCLPVIGPTHPIE